MSTKIYNAYRFDGTAEKLLEYLQRAKTKYHWAVAKRLNGLRGDMTTKQIEEKLKAISISKEFDDFNFDASCTVHFLDNIIYIVFFGTDGRGIGDKDWLREIMTIFKRDWRFKDFHYQNSTDSHEGITQKEWNHRRITWDRIFKNDHQYSGAGFSYIIFDGFEESFMIQFKMRDLKDGLFPAKEKS